MSVWCFLGSAGAGNDDYELLETVPLVEGVIGTDASCELRLSDPLLTPRHARLVRKGDAWFLGGVAAMSPTMINGVATLPGEARQLAHGDLVELANTRFRFGGEPPAREGVDAHDEPAVLMFADALAERGSPVGLRILERQTPTASWLPGLEQFVEGGVIKPEWTRGLLTAVEVRELGLGSLRRLLENEAAVALERLTLHLSTCAEKSEQETLRGVLQVLGVAKPPRLGQLRLGFVHQSPSTGGASDWAAIARRLPLQGSLGDAYRVAGEVRFVMLRAGPGTPELGAATVLGHWSFRSGDEGAHARLRMRNYLSASGGTGAFFSCSDEFTLNGRPSWDARRLIHGDVIETESFAFRLEEDPQ